MINFELLNEINGDHGFKPCMFCSSVTGLVYNQTPICWNCLHKKDRGEGLTIDLFSGEK